MIQLNVFELVSSHMWSVTLVCYRRCSCVLISRIKCHVDGIVCELVLIQLKRGKNKDDLRFSRLHITSFISPHV